MEFLIILAVTVLVILGVFFQKRLNKVKKGNSILAKEIPKSLRVATPIILIIIGAILIALISVKDTNIAISLMPVIAGLIVVITVAIFSKSGLSLIGSNSDIFDKEKNIKNISKKAYFRKRNTILIVIAVIIAISVLVDYVSNN